jgi:hypothetical protein
VLLGGDTGLALLSEANAWMFGAGVSNVDGITRMLAPGFQTRNLRHLPT